MDCIGLSRFGTSRHGGWLVGLLLFLLAWTLSAAPPAPPRRSTPARPRPAPDGHRFLFVVDISSSMRGTDAANRQALFDMLFTGLDGRMRSGDTFGLWFYNDKLHAGKFPIQVWDEKDPLPVASLATKFLREQPYSGKSRPDVLMPSLLNLIKNVRDVNVLVISHGKPALEGTPFDTNIAGIVRRKRTEREQAQKPFITALAARGGAIVSGAVVIAGESLRLPERPAAILAGKGTNSLARSTNATTTLSSVPSSEFRVPGSELSRTGIKPGSRNPEPGTAAANPELSPQPTATLAPQTALPPEPKVLQFVTRTNVVATTAAVVPARAPENSIPTSDVSWIGIDLGTGNPRPGFATANPQPLTRNPEPPQPTRPDAAPAIPVSATVASFAESMDSKPLPVAARSPAANGSSPAAAVAAAPTPGPSAALLLMIGFVLLAACLGLLLLVLRKLRPRHQGSFITRSMELR